MGRIISKELTFDIDDDSGRTDTANARRFITRFSQELLYVPPWGKWLTWDGSRWIDDCGVGVYQRATRYAVQLWDRLPELSQRTKKSEIDKVVGFIRSTNQAPKIAAFLRLAQSFPSIVCPVAELNSDPTLLNCINGTVDLVEGKMRPHNPADRITQITKVPFDANAECSRWLETINLIFDGNAEVIRYVQQLLGYSLSGETGEHILPIAYGSGCNGKSTIWNCVAEILGDYASLANDELLMGEKNNHPTEKASLYQKRFVAISEPEKNSKLKESRVKELTGDRLVTARRMHEDFWSFERTFTFWISSNHLPRIDGTDEGIWRRVKLIPFTVNLKERVKPIPDFDKWLVKHEGRGILAWMVRGYRDYKSNGLIEPDVVKQATAGYRSDSDSLADFLAEHCVPDPAAVLLANELFRVYSEVYKGKWSQSAFGRAMAERFKKSKPTNGEFRRKTIYHGIRFRCEKDGENDEVAPPVTTSAIGPENSYAKADPIPAVVTTSDKSSLADDEVAF